MLPRPAVLFCLALAGCGFYAGTEKAAQTTPIGNVLRFTVTLCATNATPGGGDATTAEDGTVTEPGNPCGQTDPSVGATRGQGLVALRLPAGMTPPETLMSGSITAVKSPSYTASFGTPPAGMQIQGYITPPQTVTQKTGYTATFDVGLPAPPAGQPFDGPVKARVLAGWRQLVNPLDDGSAPVSCGGSTTCVTSAQPAVDFSFPTRDVAIGTPPPGTLDFPLRYDGPAGPSFALGATTTIPAGSATPADPSFAPADDEDATERVTVVVPPLTPPGTYAVTLTARLGDETRSATGSYTVAAGPAGPAGPTGSAGPVKTATPSPGPAATAAPTAAPAPPRKAPRKLTLRLKKLSALAVKARGRLKRPPRVNRADGCRGRVSLVAGPAVKKTPLTGSCTYSRTLKVRRPGSYRVSARFLGNAALTAKSAKRRRFRAGR